MLLSLQKHYYRIGQVFDLQYLARVLLALVALYLLNHLFIRFSYNAFWDNHSAYTNWLRIALLNTATLFIRAAGYSVSIVGQHTIVGPYGSSVVLGWPCVGLGVMVFWMLFVAIQQRALLWKLRWLSIGLSLIWLINSTRLALLFVALEAEWNLNVIDHHKLFNRSAYLLIILLMYAVQVSSKKNVRDF